MIYWEVQNPELSDEQFSSLLFEAESQMAQLFQELA